MKSLRHLLLCGASCVAVSALIAASASAAPAQVAQAQTQNSREIEFDIAAAPLQVAILEFSRQAQVAVVAPTALLQGRTGARVVGKMLPQDALARLVAGTGLRVERSPDGGMTLVSAAGEQPPPRPTRAAVAGSETLSAASRSSVAGLEEIIVTAQKREQRLLDVPLSVTAVTAADIQKRGAHNLKDLQYSVPGLYVQETGPGQERAQIRGISASVGLPTIGRYLDEMPINADREQLGLNVRLIDMERVEVLRGPQGTLYGEGSMGGTIKYVLASPDLRRTFGSAEAELAAQSDGEPIWRIHAMLNLPLVDEKFGVRLVASHEDIGGFIDNTRTKQSDINSARTDMVRLKALLQPTDNLSASLLVLSQRTDAKNAQFGAVDRTVAYGLATPVVDRYTLANLVVKYDFGPVNLLSSTGYQYRRTYNLLDVSQFYAPLFAAFGFPSVTGVGLGAPGSYRILTQEMRLASSNDGRFNWTAGGYFRNSNYVAQLGSVTQPVAVPLSISSAGNTRYQSWALFGEASYRLLDRLEVLVGARFFHDERHEINRSNNFGATSIDNNLGTFHTFNPRFNLSWHLDDDGLLYVNVAKGFRSGGFNSQAAGRGIFQVPATYAPEKVWSYEAGVKKDLFDRRLTVEAAVYYNDWTDVQSTVLVPGSTLAVLANGGKASGMGVDFQLAWRPTDALSIGATLGWNDMKYDSTTQDHYKDDPMDFVPRLTGSLFGEFRTRLQSGFDGVARADFQHGDGYQITSRNFPPPVTRSDAINTINLRLGIESEGWQAYLFANNVADVSRRVQPAVGVITTNVLNTPRTVGANLRLQF